jgi:hypothetical protein
MAVLRLQKEMDGILKVQDVQDLKRFGHLDSFEKYSNNKYEEIVSNGISRGELELAELIES